MGKSETQLKSEVMKLVEQKLDNVYCIKYHGGPSSTRGVPDLILCWNSFFIAIELKVGKNKITELQKFHLQKIKKANGISLVLREVDMEKFVKALESIQVHAYHQVSDNDKPYVEEAFRVVNEAFVDLQKEYI